MQKPTLRQHLTEADVDRDLAGLIDDIASACRFIADHVRHGAFQGNLGAAGSTNVQGETQKQLDVISDEEFAARCRSNPRIAALVSEEVDDVNWLKTDPQAGDFIVYYDPLDGSSNVDVNLSVGTIFSVVRLPQDIEKADENAVLIKGDQQVCAGYAVYGPSTGFF
nr:hypothetical protein [Sulfitobacter sp. S190]